MRAGGIFPGQQRFSSAHPENLLVIENRPRTVIIQAERDNFSPPQKAYLIRYLAAEGFIPDRYQWFVDPQITHQSGVEWIIEGTVANPRESAHQALRQILRLIFCLSLVWLVLMSFAFLNAPATSRALLPRTSDASVPSSSPPPEERRPFHAEVHWGEAFVKTSLLQRTRISHNAAPHPCERKGVPAKSDLLNAGQHPALFDANLTGSATLFIPLPRRPARC